MVTAADEREFAQVNGRASAAQAIPKRIDAGLRHWGDRYAQVRQNLAGGPKWFTI